MEKRIELMVIKNVLRGKRNSKKSNSNLRSWDIEKNAMFQ
jgi:hypothetical protein